MNSIRSNDFICEDYKDYKLITAIENNLDGKKVKIGKLVLQPGSRIPIKEFTAHEADEYSIVIKGNVVFTTKSKSTNLNAGDINFVPMQEEHWCSNDGDTNCELIWVLVDKDN